MLKDPFDKGAAGMIVDHGPPPGTPPTVRCTAPMQNEP